MALNYNKVRVARLRNESIQEDYSSQAYRNDLQREIERLQRVLDERLPPPPKKKEVTLDDLSVFLESLRAHPKRSRPILFVEWCHAENVPYKRFSPSHFRMTFEDEQFDCWPTTCRYFPFPRKKKSFNPEPAPKPKSFNPKPEPKPEPKPKSFNPEPAPRPKPQRAPGQYELGLETAPPDQRSPANGPACRKCGAPIGFKKNANDKWYPINPADGSNHFATCETRNEFREEHGPHTVPDEPFEAYYDGDDAPWDESLGDFQGCTASGYVVVDEKEPQPQQQQEKLCHI